MSSPGQQSESARCHRSGSNPNNAEWQWRANNETTCADCLRRVGLVTFNSRARRRTAHYLAEHSSRPEAETSGLWCLRCDRIVQPEECHEGPSVGVYKTWWFHSCGDSVCGDRLPDGVTLREFVSGHFGGPEGASDGR